MATTAVVTDEQSAVEAMTSVTSEQVTYAITRNLKDNKIGLGILKQGNSLWIASRPNPETGDASHVTKEILRTITIPLPSAHNLQGISEICADEEEAAARFNVGAEMRLKSVVLSRYGVVKDGSETELEGDEQEITLSLDDAKEFIAEPLKRRVVSDEAKLRKIAVANPEAFAAVMRSLGYQI